MTYYSDMAAALRTGVAADIWYDTEEFGDDGYSDKIQAAQAAMIAAADLLDQLLAKPPTTVWILATDTRDGTEAFLFKTKAAFDAHMHTFMSGHWDEDERGEMPAEWEDAWDALDNMLGDLDSFQWDEFDISDHPALLSAGLSANVAEPQFADKFRAVAKEKHHDEGSIEIDDAAIVSRGDDDGCYVQAWIWVSDDDASIGNACDHCYEVYPSAGDGYDGLCPSCADEAELTRAED